MSSLNTSPLLLHYRCWRAIPGVHLTVSPSFPLSGIQQSMSTEACLVCLLTFCAVNYIFYLVDHIFSLCISPYPSFTDLLVRNHRHLTTMPSLRAEAPPYVPDEETIEYLLSEADKSSKFRAKISPLQDVKPDVRQRTGLITLGKLQQRIQGDPYGYYFSWAGNVSHSADMRVVSYLPVRVKEIL